MLLQAHDVRKKDIERAAHGDRPCRQSSIDFVSAVTPTVFEPPLGLYNFRKISSGHFNGVRFVPSSAELLPEIFEGGLDQRYRLESYHRHCGMRMRRSEHCIVDDYAAKLLPRVDHRGRALRFVIFPLSGFTDDISLQRELTWTVLTDPILITKEQLDWLAVNGQRARQVQDICARKIEFCSAR
uniref:Uncharacterized protein n=1 Tax=Globodera rostochiensis TaxID=31243 RepID=A0A914H4I7_GLORO